MTKSKLRTTRSLISGAYRCLKYNSTNLGEMGRFIRVEYAKNILEVYVKEARKKARKG